MKTIPKSTKQKRHLEGPKRKATIPVAFREQIWLRQFGKVFEAKCPTSWCQNKITVYDFQSGHNIPESKGGPTTPENLIPLCSRCNLSMGDRYTFDEWTALSKQPPLQGMEEASSRPPLYTEVTAVKTSGLWCCC
jgi:hypothetical protein